MNLCALAIEPRGALGAGVLGADQVVEDGALVGIVTTTDLIRYLLDQY